MVFRLGLGFGLTLIVVVEDRVDIEAALELLRREGHCYGQVFFGANSDPGSKFCVGG